MAAGKSAGRGSAALVDLEAEIRRVRQGLRSGTTCRSCGHVNPGGSRFCTGCGSALASGSTGGAGTSG